MQVEHLRFLEDGQFAKIYKGNLLTSQSSFGSTTSNYSGQQNGHAASGPKQIVSIKVPRVPEAIRKEKSKTPYRLVLITLPIFSVPFITYYAIENITSYLRLKPVTFRRASDSAF